MVVVIVVTYMSAHVSTCDSSVSAALCRTVVANRTTWSTSVPVPLCSTLVCCWPSKVTDLLVALDCSAAAAAVSEWGDLCCCCTCDTNKCEMNLRESVCLSTIATVSASKTHSYNHIKHQYNIPHTTIV